MRFSVIFIFIITCVFSVADSVAQKKHNFIKSDKIAIQLLPYKDDPKNFLRFTSNRIDKNIRISIKLDIKNVKLVDISDIYADEERCDYRHSTKVAYLYFDPPVNTNEVITTISKPCVYKHNAKLKLKIATANNEFLYRTYTFPVHHLSNYY